MAADGNGASRAGTLGLAAVRIGLPASIALAGAVLLVVGGATATGAGIVLLGVAVLVTVFNLLARLSNASERDREREAAARRHFERHGSWPRDEFGA